MNPELGKLLRLSTPIGVTYLLEAAMAITDALIVSRLGHQEFAAVSLVVTIVFGLMNISLAALSAVGTNLARSLTVGESIRPHLRTGIVFATLLAFVCTFCLLLVPNVFALLNQPEIITKHAGDYARFVAWGIVPYFVTLVLRHLFQATYRGRIITYVMAGALLVNALLSSMLTLGLGPFPRLGVSGAGLATSIVNWLVLITMVALVRMHQSTAQHLRTHEADGHSVRLRDTCREGMFLAVGQGLEQSFFIWVALLVGRMGINELTAHQTALTLLEIVVVFYYAIGDATMYRVAACVRQRQLCGARQVMRWGLALAVPVSLCLAVVTALAASELATILLRPNAEGDWRGPNVILLTTEVLLLASIVQIIEGFQSVALGALRGLRAYAAVVRLTGVGYWAIGAPIVLVAASLGGGSVLAVWMAMAATLSTLAVFFTASFYRMIKAGQENETL